MSSLNDSEEHTSPPAMPGSRGVHVANSHFSNINANSGNNGWLYKQNAHHNVAFRRFFMFPTLSRLQYNVLQFNFLITHSHGIVCVVTATDKRYFSPITWLNISLSTVKVTNTISMPKLASGISKFWIIFELPRWYATWRMRSDRSVWWKCDKIQSSITHEWITAGWIYETPSSSKGQRSRSQAHMKIEHKYIKYVLQTLSDSGSIWPTRVIGNQGHLIERWGQIFDRKLLNSRFCACAVKMCECENIV